MALRRTADSLTVEISEVVGSTPGLTPGTRADSTSSRLFLVRLFLVVLTILRHRIDELTEQRTVQSHETTDDTWRDHGYIVSLDREDDKGEVRVRTPIRAS